MNVDQLSLNGGGSGGGGLVLMAAATTLTTVYSLSDTGTDQTSRRSWMGSFPGLRFDDSGTFTDGPAMMLRQTLNLVTTPLAPSP